MKNFKITLTAAAALWIVCSFAAHADEQDVENAKDHPMFSRIPDYYISDYASNFDAFEFPVSRNKAEFLEGQKFVFEYNIKDDVHPSSSLQILKNYANAVKQLGGIVMYDGPFEGRAVYYDRAQSFKIVKGASEVWVMATTFDEGERYQLVILERGGMAQEVTASDMLSALNRDGRVALYIHFETGKADIKPESRTVIEEITRLMTNMPEFAFIVEGHTDNSGSADANKILSEKRAGAVVQALTRAGVVLSRLSAVGYGADRPIADNASEEGRARNRRVELVRK